MAGGHIRWETQAEDHLIAYCQNCGKLYCMNCSEANGDDFCSKKCEEEAGKD